MSLDEFMAICPLGFRRPPSRTVGAIIVCCRDEDGMHPSLTPVQFEALDALGFEKRGGQIPIPRPICVTNLTVTLNHTLKETSACDVCGMSSRDINERCQ